jgi:N-acetylmuramoyl-L-alanine amidase
VQDNGIVMLTSGKLPLFELKRGVDGTWMTVDIMGARLIAEDIKPGQLTNRSGLTITQATQLSNSPPVVRVTLSLPDTRREWQARAYAGGLAIWPEGATPPTINEATGFATVESVELKNGTELVLTADRQVNYTSGWDPEEDAYGITIFNAKVSDGLRLPGREVGSPLLWVRLRREDPETVTLLVKPATRIEVGDVTQVSPRQLSLPMGWGEIGETPPGWRPSRDRQPAPQASNPLPPLWPGRRNPAPQNRQPSQQPNLDSFPGGPRRAPFPWPPRRRNEPQPQNRRPFPWPTPAPQRDGRVSIVIDPGHGGPTDLGGVGIGGLREKDIVLPMSLEVAKILEQNGIQVIMTRTTDRDLDLPPRTELANRVNADLFVSIHANAISMSRPDVNGLETFYYQSGRQLAEYIQKSMLDSFPTMNDRGVRRARFYVLRNTAMPAALVEVGFVTGNYDSRILADPVQRSRMAQAVARGILNYVNAYYR